MELTDQTCPAAVSARPTAEALLRRRWLLPPLEAIVHEHAQQVRQFSDHGCTPSPDLAIALTYKAFTAQQTEAVGRLLGIRVAALAQLIVLEEQTADGAYFRLVTTILIQLVRDAVPAALAHQPLPWSPRRSQADLRVVRAE